MTPHPALEAYRTKVERLLQTTDSLLQATDSNRPVPPVLYHYTDAQGLYGIAQTKELWATNVSYLNDSQEVHYGHGLAREFIKRFAPDSRIYNILRRGLGYFASMADPANVDNYVISFCSEPDLLSQWRAYGNNGTGYAIGFSTPELMELTRYTGGSHSLSLFPLVYEKQLQLQLLADYAQATEQYCEERAVGDLGWEDLRSWLDIILKCKHSQFREENEWRLSWVLLYPYSGPFYRVRRGDIVPYFKIRLNIKMVTSVMVGPTVNPELAQRAIRDMVMRSGFAYAKTVEVSTLPLRP